MALAEKKMYLANLVNLLKKQWPENRTVNIVCHGHSVPAGYFATPFVDTFNAYPHILHRKLKERFPLAVINVIVTAIGGENSISGAKRFSQDVLCHKPDLVLIDYGLNDRTADASSVQNAWTSMVRQAKENNVAVMLLTPTWDFSVVDPQQDYGKLLKKQAEIIRTIASEEEVAFADSYTAFEKAVSNGVSLETLMSWINHPSRKGHEIVVDEILAWFPF
ncbi:MAG TPA: SGNH/GDSL hydrolase family protein [bacterium]|nr:SGNH/GDSL hydrolase family protein [bacterium]HOL49068.1 SGNH/GDSL hydrolase family protein [bacterium]HPO52088.1 SGNH/GDSL hydrolase family protein [bacterium]HXK45244.1 SGNH/GDSL hydrolase family protein [bacterium]